MRKMMAVFLALLCLATGCGAQGDPKEPAGGSENLDALFDPPSGENEEGGICFSMAALGHGADESLAKSDELDEYRAKAQALLWCCAERNHSVKRGDAAVSHDKPPDTTRRGAKNRMPPFWRHPVFDRAAVALIRKASHAKCPFHLWPL